PASAQHWPRQHRLPSQGQYFQPTQPATSSLLPLLPLPPLPPPPPPSQESAQHPRVAAGHMPEHEDGNAVKRLRSNAPDATQLQPQATTCMEQPIPTISVAEVADLYDFNFSVITVPSVRPSVRRPTNTPVHHNKLINTTST